MREKRSVELQHQYLEAMGIPVWQRRRVTDSAMEDQAAKAGEAADTSTDVAGPDPRPVRSDGPRQAAAPESLGLEAQWQQLRAQVAGCTRCSLCEGRTQTVFGVGSEQARLLIVGEAPGAEEDRRGEPFVGRAGQLLDRMLQAIGLDRDQVFIANILKCRPPNNRDPQADEVNACMPYLREQMRLLEPRVILCVGRVAAQNLLQQDRPLRDLRAGSNSIDVGGNAVPVVVSYHPAYLLRTPADKHKAWQDLKRVRGMLREPGA
jgi:uracil-DNA glycosylase